MEHACKHKESLQEEERIIYCSHPFSDKSIESSQKAQMRFPLLQLDIQDLLTEQVLIKTEDLALIELDTLLQQTIQDFEEGSPLHPPTLRLHFNYYGVFYGNENKLAVILKLFFMSFLEIAPETDQAVDLEVLEHAMGVQIILKRKLNKEECGQLHTYLQDGFYVSSVTEVNGYRFSRLYQAKPTPYVIDRLTIPNAVERINRVKEVLAAKGISQKKLAKLVKKNVNTIAGISNNRHQPSLNLLKEIAEFLNVDIRELLVNTK